jgi:hypothetical protein
MSALPKQAPPRERLKLLSSVVIQGQFCAPECPNKSAGSVCNAQTEPEKLTLNSGYEMYSRTTYCRMNAR